MNLSERVVRAREHAGLTQEQLAAEIRKRNKLHKKVSQQTIAKLERGAKSTRYIAEISSICGVNPDWLASGEGEWLGQGGADAMSRDAWRIASMYDKLPPFLKTQVWLFVEMQCALFDSRAHQFPREIAKNEADFYARLIEDRRRLLDSEKLKNK